MLDLTTIEGFDWDEGNQPKSEEEHSVSQGEAEQVFFSTPLYVAEDVPHSRTEAAHKLFQDLIHFTDDRIRMSDA